ncbi:MAG: RluA family pseudouridine synthase [Planctomycetota bacterium]|nr:RluA family pseudouridine synthase [Planctomycetota bacterium]
MVLTPGRDLSLPPGSAVFRVRQEQRKRLDRWLQDRLGWSSRSKIQKLIAQERVLLNGNIAKSSARVANGDEIEVLLDVDPETAQLPEKLPVIAEDPWLLAIDKPSGMLVHPVGRTHAGTVVDGLHRQWRFLNERSIRKVTARLCHRLDRDTSGLLLLAKTVQARRHLQNSFEADRVRKSYIAVVEGVPDSDSFEVDAGVSAHLDRTRATDHRLARADDEEGKPSRTLFQVLGEKNGISVLHCQPITGRQNQIRVHLQVAGHPILGDEGYGQTEATLEQRGAALPRGIDHPDRALLHSFQLQFPHPVWNLEQQMRCHPTGNLAALVEALGLDPQQLHREIPEPTRCDNLDGNACQGAPLHG